MNTYTALHVTRPAFWERVFMPWFRWAARRNDKIRLELDEWHEAMAYAHEVDAIEYLQRRGVLRLSETAILCERLREGRTP